MDSTWGSVESGQVNPSPPPHTEEKKKKKKVCYSVIRIINLPWIGCPVSTIIAEVPVRLRLFFLATCLHLKSNSKINGLGPRDWQEFGDHFEPWRKIYIKANPV